MTEKMLEFKQNGATVASPVEKASDPVVSNVATPGDFTAQYPIPLDMREIIAMCDEVSMLQAIPQENTGLKAYTWREMDELDYVSGSDYVAFADGACPEEYEHDGDNYTLTLKNIGAKKSLMLSDIIDSQAKAMGYGDAINRLIAPGNGTEGMPGDMGASRNPQTLVQNLKQKEIELASILVTNGWDEMIANGNTDDSALQFSGFENWESNNSVSFHTNATDLSGTFSAESFNQFLSEMCVKPSHVFGNSRAIQEIQMQYFELGYQGSQIVNFTDGNRITPGFNFGSLVNTAHGTLNLVADNNFSIDDSFGTYYTTNVFAMRMSHMGVPLVTRMTQIPLVYRDLTPGCTSISFQLWAKTALLIRQACAHGKYHMFATGRTGITTCPVIV